jgi:hypothetical protein
LWEEKKSLLAIAWNESSFSMKWADSTTEFGTSGLFQLTRTNLKNIAEKSLPAFLKRNPALHKLLFITATQFDNELGNRVRDLNFYPVSVTSYVDVVLPTSFLLADNLKQLRRVWELKDDMWSPLTSVNPWVLQFLDKNTDLESSQVFTVLCTMLHINGIGWMKSPVYKAPSHSDRLVKDLAAAHVIDDHRDKTA